MLVTKFSRYGDIKTAWAPKSSRGQFEYLEFEYPHMMIVKGIDIYETYNPGSVFRISIRDAIGKWVIVYEDKPHQQKLQPVSRIFSPQLMETDFLTNVVRIDMDTRSSSSWSEIDAVQIFGFSYTAQGPDPIREQIPSSYIRDLNRLFDNSRRGLSTSKISCGAVGKSDDKIEYSVHLPLIKHRCPVLYEKITNAYQNNHVDGDHLNDAISVMIRYIYTDEVVIPSKSEDVDAIDLKQSDQRLFDSLKNAAEVYQLPILGEFCTKLESYLSFVTWRDYCPLIAATLPTTMESDMHKLMQDQETADVTFEIAHEDSAQQIRAHAFILKNRSAYFDALLSRWISEGESKSIQIEDLSLPAFQSILEYLYLGATRVDESNAVELMIAGNQYLLEDFTLPAEKIKESINDENVLEILQMAHNYSQLEVFTKCVENLEKKNRTEEEIHSLIATVKNLDEELREKVVESSSFIKLMVETGDMNEIRKFISKKEQISTPISAELQTLLDMGFELGFAQTALQICNNNVQQAIDSLYENLDDEDYDGEDYPF
jgi:hypothetical protein